MEAELVADLVALLERDTRLAPVLAAALEVEAQRQGEEFWVGWSWHDVGGPTHVPRRLVELGLAEVTYHSNRTTDYRLLHPVVIVEALRLAQAGGRPPAEPAPPEELPLDLFDMVEGLDEVKRTLVLALRAERPVHVLLRGPAGSAKTLLLEEVARLPGGQAWIGGTTTSAGLVGYLLAEPAVRYLCIDELDKMVTAHLAALLSVMETGRVSRLQHGHRDTARRVVWVLAGANRTARFPPELLDRFEVVDLEPYPADLYGRVVEAVLVRREDCDPELARELARAVTATGSRSVRRAVRIARMSHGDRRLALDLVHRLPA